jgi:DNA-directed RNA polymerase specialized sigma24 family protein
LTWRMQSPMTVPAEDATLVAAIRRGDLDALGTLYDRHARMLVGLAYRILQNADDADDVVQDVFVGLPEALRWCSNTSRSTFT